MAYLPDNYKDSSYYDVAQVCINGHVINEFAGTQQEHNQEYCSRCGAATTSTCPSCNRQIRGHLHGDLTIMHKPPAFCYKCGKPYPWTEARLKAAREMADELDHLSDAEKETLKKTIDDLVRETPGTPLAASRFKRLISKAGQAAGKALYDLLVDVMSEAAKKILTGP